MPYLIVLTGLRSGAVVSVTERIVLGRGADVDLRLPDLLVSARHVEVRPEGDSFQVHDLASTNGTYKNGVRIQGGDTLNREDVLTIGSTEVAFTEREVFDTTSGPTRVHQALVPSGDDPAWEVRILADVEEGLRLDGTRSWRGGGLPEALPVVHHVQRSFSLAVDLRALVRRIGQQFALAVGGSGVVVALEGDPKPQIALRATMKNGALFEQEELEFAVREDLLERALKKPGALLARAGPDNSETAVVGPGSESPPQLALCVALPSAAGVVGAVYVHGAQGDLDKDDLRLLYLIANLAGVNLRNQLLLSEVRDRNAALVTTNRELELAKEELRGAMAESTAALGRAGHSARLLSRVVETIPEAVVSLTLEGEVTTWNRGAEALYGYPATEVLGEVLPTIPDRRGDELERLLLAVAEGRTVSLRTERVARDDGVVPILATCAPVPSEDGEDVVGMVEIGRGLTEQLRDEERMRWQERLASFGELAAGLAHELGGPLTNLRSGVEFLLARERSPAETRESLEVLRVEIDRLHGLAQQALDLARWKAPVTSAVDCGELADYVLGQIERRAAELNVTLVRGEDEPTVRVIADPDQIKQALLNLLNNSLAAMPNGGRLELSLIDEEDAGGFVVSDSGRGIAIADQSQIFNLFFSRSPGGSGIGLAIVKRIVDLHAGSALLESAPGEGTTMRIRLPKGEASP